MEVAASPVSIDTENCRPDAGGLEIPMTFRPFSGGSKSTTVTLETDSIDSPTVTINLIGTGVN